MELLERYLSNTTSSLDKDEYIQVRPGGLFIENRGQARLECGHFYITGERISVAFGQGWVSYNVHGDGGEGGCLIRMRFPSANQVEPRGTSPLDFPTHFLKGRAQSDWITDVRSYNGILYSNLWEGIDLHFTQEVGMLKYAFLLRPGADPLSIGMDYEGILGLRIDEDTGNLLIDTEAGTVTDTAPIAFQEGEAGSVDVRARFCLEGEASVRFDVGHYDRNHPLTIDPGIEFSTYLGGSDEDVGSQVAVGDDGSLYVTGNTLSTDFPTTPGAYCQTTHKEHFSFFIAKFDKNASSLLYCTFIDGFQETLFNIRDIKADNSGCAWIVGHTNSSTFPVTQDAYCTTITGGIDGYLLKLNPIGSGVAYGTYIGGSGDDHCGYLELSQSGDALISGRTGSGDFPTTPSAYCTTNSGSNDIFLLRLNTTTSILEFSTYIGGNGNDYPDGFAVDASGNAYVLMGSREDDFPTTSGAYSTRPKGGEDAIVFKMDESGSTLLFSTYIGGSKDDFGEDIDVDVDGSVWICGWLESRDYPTTRDALQPEFGGGNYDCFLTQLSPNGSALEYSSYLSIGRGTSDTLVSLTLGGYGRPFVYGYTNATRASFPHLAISNTSNGDFDAFIIWFDTLEGRILNGTFIGGGGREFSGEIISTTDHSVVITGSTDSPNFPTSANGYQRLGKGERDCFLTGISMEETPWNLPSVPRNLSATPDDGAVELKWEPPSYDSEWPVERYIIYMGKEQGCETRVAEAVGGCNIRLKDLVNGDMYYIRVSAETVVGEGPSTQSLVAIPRGIPGAPTGFSATPGCGSVRLEWSEPSDSGGMPVLGYHMFRGKSILDQAFFADVGNVTEHFDIDLQNGEVYYYRIRAYNIAGNGTFSTIIHAVPTGPPGVPLYFRAQPGEGTVRLLWRAPVNDGGIPISGYLIYRGLSEDSLSEYSKLGVVEELIDSDVENGRTYYYSIVALNEHGRGPAAPTVNATPRGAPDRPMNVSARGEDGRVILQWDPPENDGGSIVLAFRVYRGESMEGLGFLTEVEGSTDFTDLDVINGLTYFYGISATNEYGEGPRSQVVSASSLGPAGPVVNFSIETGDGTVTLKWQLPKDTGGAAIVGIRVFKGTTPEDLSTMPDLDPSTAEFEDIGLVNGVTYFYAVTVITEFGEGAMSDTVSGTPIGPPGAPSNPVASRGNGLVTLSWLPPEIDGGTRIQGYHVLRDKDVGNLEVLVTIGNLTEFIDREVLNGHNYYYSVVAFNYFHNGSRSAIVHATPAGPPREPVNLTVEEQDGQVRLSWEMPLNDGGSPVTHFIILRGISPDDLIMVKELGLSLEYTDSDVREGVKYYYCVTASNEVDTGEPSIMMDIELKKKADEGHEPINPYVIIGVALPAVAIGVITILFVRNRKISK